MKLVGWLTEKEVRYKFTLEMTKADVLSLVHALSDIPIHTIGYNALRELGKLLKEKVSDGG